MFQIFPNILDSIEAIMYLMQIVYRTGREYTAL